MWEVYFSYFAITVVIYEATYEDVAISMSQYQNTCVCVCARVCNFKELLRLYSVYLMKICKLSV
jgi:hypothetical protein